MRLLFLSVFLFCISFITYSQSTFRPGYFIDEAGNRTNCLIKDLDWRDNPTEFSFKIEEDGQERVQTLSGVVEFGVNDKSKYQKFEVQIDRSRDKIEDLDNSFAPNFNEETLFLKVLIEGQVSLYSYQAQTLQRFFIRTANSSRVQQLVFKKFVTAANPDQVSINQTYKQQLRNVLQCNGSGPKVENMLYARKDLRKAFINYYECQGLEYEDFDLTDRSELINITLKAGISGSSFIAKNDDLKYLENGTLIPTNIQFPTSIAVRISAEIEFVLPYKNGVWAFALEPNYQWYKASYTTPGQDAQIDYTNLEIAAGPRRYFNISEKSRLYAGASAGLNFLNSDSFLIATNQILEVKNSLSIILSGGYKFSDKISIEGRYMLDKDLLQAYNSWFGPFSNFALLAGYTF